MYIYQRQNPDLCRGFLASTGQEETIRKGLPGVDSCPYAKIIGCKEAVDWHTDESFDPWSILLCLQNKDMFIQDTSNENDTNQVQVYYPKVGDLILLNIHEYHRADSLPSKYFTTPYCIFANKDYKRKPKPITIYNWAKKLLTSKVAVP